MNECQDPEPRQERHLKVVCLGIVVDLDEEQLRGVSLTVADALPNGDFQVAIIPHTWEVTTLRELQSGSRVNLEIDMLARYVARMIGVDAPTPHDAQGASDV